MGIKKALKRGVVKIERKVGGKKAIELGYFVRLHKRVLGLRGKYIKDFANEQSLIDYIRKSLPPAWYISITVWDGKVFDAEDIKLDENRDIFIRGIKSNNYQAYRNYVYALAASENQYYSKREREANKELVRQIRIKSRANSITKRHTPRITPRTPRLRR